MLSSGQWHHRLQRGLHAFVMYYTDQPFAHMTVCNWAGTRVHDFTDNGVIPTRYNSICRVARPDIYTPLLMLVPQYSVQELLCALPHSLDHTPMKLPRQFQHSLHSNQRARS
jgi:hypothetical protein